MKSPTHQSLSCNPRRFVSRCRQQQRVLGPLFARPRLTQHAAARSEEHTSELQSQSNLVCRLLLEKKKKQKIQIVPLLPHLHQGPAPTTQAHGTTSHPPQNPRTHSPADTLAYHASPHA